ncbi:MAG: hypothetical protein QXY94_05295, partial [Archaeoglobaceae archaeon]
MTLEEFVELLREKGLKPRQLPNGQWLALCPAHDDSEPSLSITLSETGKVLLHCFAGCDITQICDALGISIVDLSSDNTHHRVNLTLAQLADCKKVPYNFLASLGWRDTERGVAIPFSLPDGHIVFQYRHALDKDGARGVRYSWEKGVQAAKVVYGLSHLCEGSTEVWLTESALDAVTLQFVGLPAIAVAGQGNAKAVAHFADKLSRVDKIIVWQEPDAPNFASEIAAALGRSVFCVQPEEGMPKDANRLWLSVGADKERFLAELSRLRERAVVVEPSIPKVNVHENTKDEKDECVFCQMKDEELLEVAKPLLHADDPLEFAAQLIEHATGIVAERKNIKLLLLIATTRIFDQPLHAYIVAPTGAGKSALTNAVVQSLPPCQVQRLVGASALSLLAHELREGTLVEWKEAPHHWHENSLSATVLRSVLWQQPHEKGAYLTLEYTNKRGYRKIRWQLPKRLSFVMTSTEPPKDPQLRTRLWMIELEETPERRFAILNAIAAKFATDNSSRPSLEPLMAFNEFIARKSIRVHVPFAPFLAHQLAETMPATRDFRDFEGLLKLIAANAIWNWASRKKDETANEVVIIATPDDYASVFALVQDAWKVDRSDVTASQRRVYDAIANWSDGQLPSCADIARKLRVTDEAVRKALKALLGKRLIEEVDGRPKRYRVIADIVPTVILPDPETVRMAMQHGSLGAGLPASQPEANFPTQSQLGVGWQKNSTNIEGSDHFQLFQLSYHIRSANRQEQHTSDND